VFHIFHNAIVFIYASLHSRLFFTTSVYFTIAPFLSISTSRLLLSQDEELTACGKGFHFLSNVKVARQKILQSAEVVKQVILELSV